MGLQGGSPSSLGEGQSMAECELFPRENGRPTCEGPARELILRKRDNFLNCNEERREKRQDEKEDQEIKRK